MMTPLTAVMNMIPRISKMKPIVPVVPKVAAFLMTRKKPFQAEVQKFFAVSAIWI